MEETAQWAHKLAERVGSELNIPIYLIEKIKTNIASFTSFFQGGTKLGY
ncbi:hypothetical protein N9Y26_00475 [bacterium]|nr:hypothetical protein [bacterium]